MIFAGNSSTGDVWDWAGSAPTLTGTNWTTTTNNTYDIGGISHAVLNKTKDSKLDILADFFGPGLHALAISYSDNQMSFIQFMDRYEMIWIQTHGRWSAYNKKDFMDFINNEDVYSFSGQALSRNEILKRLAKPK